jgi:asparagine synthase (glutamine-hydrolysing)
MCGIFGAFGVRLSDHAIGQALAAIRPRGPDGEGYHRLSETQVMGHTRLAIIDLSQMADQPMRGLQGRLWLIFNGEIYNAPEIRATITDYPYQTDHSDSEAILAAYARWGLDCVDHLRGMFAFALWDAAENRLMLAVDRFSIKSLYLHRRADGGVLFASTALALGGAGVPLAPNMPAFHAFLADGVLETCDQTFFDGIHQLPAATVATWTPDGTWSQRTYWDCPVAPPQEGPAVSLDEIGAWIDETLSLHLLSDVPVGVCLSSGLDSNLVRARAARLGTPLQGFAFGFPGSPYDEPARTRASFGDDLAIHETPITADALWNDLTRATRALELPLGGVAIYGHYRNAQTARRQGVTVLLGGEGADEVFGGYRYYAEAAIGDLWRRGEQAAAQDLYDAFAAAEPGGWPHDPAALATRLDRPAEAKAPDGTSLAETFLSADFAASPSLPQVPTAQGDPVRTAMWRDMRHLKLPKLLRWQDRCYMASGVEVRVPFLDHRLFERMARVPTARLFRGGVTKAPLRELLEQTIPGWKNTQPKLYVATPQREWLKHDLAAAVAQRLTADALTVQCGMVDLDRLRARTTAWQGEQALGNSFFLWKFLAAEAFFEAFFTGTDRLLCAD